MPAPAVRLETSLPQPSLDTLPMAELRRLSRDGLGEHEHALGLYKVDLRTGMRLEYTTTNDGRSACLGLREVTVDVQLVDRRIYLARELQRGGCRHGVTLAHEQQHARIDDTIFARELPRLRQALAQAAAESGVVGPIAANDVPAHRDDVGERLQRVLQHQLERINAMRRREQGAIDTPESYRREAERCPDALK